MARITTLIQSTILFLSMLWTTFIPSIQAGTILVPKSCSPPLPTDWFLDHHQTPPSLSGALQAKFNNTSVYLASFIDATLQQFGNIESVSIMVGSPWGPVFEHNNGKLRRNDTDDEREVGSNSLYRIGSISKVTPQNSLISLAFFPFLFYPNLSCFPCRYFVNLNRFSQSLKS